MPYFDIRRDGVVINRIKAGSLADALALCPDGAEVETRPADSRELKRARDRYDTAVREEAARRLSIAVGPYTPEERDTWPVQISAAEKVLKDGGGSPILEPLAQARGISVKVMAQLVLEKSAAFEAASGEILAAQKTLLESDPPVSDFASDKHWPNFDSA